MVVDQLQQILVAGKHDGIDPMAGCLLGKCGNDIICLNADHGDGRDIHCLENIIDEGNLRMQVLRGCITVGLVGRIHFMAERQALAVHRHHKVVWLVFTHNLQDRREKTIDGRNIVSFCIFHRIIEKPIIGTIYKPISINNIELFSRRHDRRFRFHFAFLRSFLYDDRWPQCSFPFQGLLIKIVFPKQFKGIAQCITPLW